MKILLASSVIPKSMTLNVMPPLGLGYLATAIRKAGAGEVRILDCRKEGYNLDKFSEYVRSYSPDIIGFQMFSHDIPRVNRCIAHVKGINASIITIIGGPHPSGAGKDCLRHIPNADFGFKGEAERGLPELIKVIKKNKGSIVAEAELENIPGLIWRRKDGNLIANQQIFVDDLDSLGPVAWDLLDPATYPDAPQGVIFRRLPVAPVIITRGCPYQCTFCAGRTISGEKIRRRSIKDVLDEFEMLYRKYKIKEFHILDDNFTLDKNYVRSFCKELIDRKLRIWWCCPNGVRLDTLDKEILLLMKKSGCYYISVGIESGSDKILRDMKKSLTLDQIRNQVNQAKKAGFDVNGFFIIGYPGETERDILSTINFARSLPLTRAAFYNFLPLMGTEIYEQLSRTNQISEPDWEHMFQTMRPYCPKDVSPDRLKSLQRKAYRDFYIRPKILLALLGELKTFNQFKFILRRAKACLT